MNNKTIRFLNTAVVPLLAYEKKSTSQNYNFFLSPPPSSYKFPNVSPQNLPLISRNISRKVSGRRDHIWRAISSGISL